MNFKVAISPGATLTDMDGKSVIFSKKSGAFYGLNNSANQLLDGLVKSDFDSTVTKYASLYGVQREVLVADISEMLDELLELKLVTKSLI